MTGWHNYTTVYQQLFEGVKNDIKHVFELGLGTNNTDVPSNMGVNGKPGASLRGWREFFPNAQISGADIDKRVLFTEDRISTYYCDQKDPAVIRGLWEHIPQQFEFMLDDGLHSFAANKCFFENSYHKLAVGGVYIVEDIQPTDVAPFLAQIKKWQSDMTNFSFRFVDIPHAKNNYDNRLLIIKRNA